jgi:hypothetical protein
LTPGLENKRGAFKKLLDWSSFLDMAARGLYSYNTELDHGPDAQYYLVARPERPISIEDLPADVRDALQLTILAVSFPETTRIPEVQTL